MAVACTYGVSSEQLKILRQRLPNIPSPGIGECQLRCGINADAPSSINGSINTFKFQIFYFLVCLFSSLVMNLKIDC